MEKYSFELKYQVVQDYLSGVGSIAFIANKYSIPAKWRRPGTQSVKAPLRTVGKANSLCEDQTFFASSAKCFASRQVTSAQRWAAMRSKVG